MKKTHKHNCLCPSCSKMMEVSALSCRDCDLTLSGRFNAHPLMKLDEDMLHFLHVFIVCEGKIADMEKALGISYPTVKNKIHKLKESVSQFDFVDKSESHSELDMSSMSVIEILELMNKGAIPYEQGLKQIKLKKEK